MRHQDGACAIELAPRELIEVKDGQGIRVCITAGAVWITQQHDPRDIVLTRGDCFVLDRPGVALLSALSISVIEVVAASPIDSRTARALRSSRLETVR